jgi:hypothetical protein
MVEVTAVSIAFDHDRLFRVEAELSVKAMMATILKDRLILRGVNSLTPSDYEEIVEQMIERLTKLELHLAAGVHEP